ncbi:hypothetical protein [Granulicella arctica]|uniref:Uncharacterized protein YacL n=1 Tax=Granulicella arctica TaxID=940613 RepID=A0A7Y9THC9_9BACT|nr:hypothetical protein [Granulicella arctica]NYF80936.1 uncharacterized protein YacL [Granulicella arctica]
MISHPISLSEINKAADDVFLWLSLYLFMALVSAYKIWRSFAFVATADSSDERLSNGKKVFLGMMIFVGLQIALYASSDIFRLCLAFPFWGTFVLALFVLLIYIVSRFFRLNQEEVGEYTLQADIRDEIDKEWKRKDDEKRRLQKWLIIWIAADGIAILWLMALTHRSLKSLTSFLAS